MVSSVFIKIVLVVSVTRSLGFIEGPVVDLNDDMEDGEGIVLGDPDVNRLYLTGLQTCELDL